MFDKSVISGIILSVLLLRVVSSEVERFLDTEEVRSSILLSPIKIWRLAFNGRSLFFALKNLCESYFCYGAVVVKKFSAMLLVVKG